MNKQLAFRKPKVNLLILAITLAVIALSQIDYGVSSSIQYALLIAGTIIIGIPHGATDDQIFSKTSLSRILPGDNKSYFYGVYILVIAIYTALWLISPLISLIIFLLISVYHFGQSHLFYIEKVKPLWAKTTFYLLWGTYVLMLPLMFSYAEASPIIREIIGFTPFSETFVSQIAVPTALYLMGINVLFLTVLLLVKNLPVRNYFIELANLAALGALAYFTPLFVAFITYWALWHSFNSVVEISTFLSRQHKKLNFKYFYKKALPLSLITFLGIGLLFFITQSFGSKETLLAVFFIIIAAITLPHTIVMEFLYKEKQVRNYE